MDHAAPQPLPQHLSLVPVERTARRNPATGLTHGNSGFVAHLLAGRLDAPVSRRLRRAAPADAMRSYAAAAALLRA